MMRAILTAVLLTMAVATIDVPATRADGAEIPLAYRVEVEVIEPNGTHVVIDVGYGTSDLAAALAKVATINRDGFCLIVEGDKLLAATCYPPVRFVRTHIIKSWI